MEISNRFHPGIVVALLLAAAGCSSGGGSGGANAPQVSPLAGNWTGSATDTTTGEVLNASAFIDESGEAQLMVMPRFAFLGPNPVIPAPLMPTVPTIRPELSTEFEFVGGVSFAAATIFVLHGNLCCEPGIQGTASAESMNLGIKSTSQISGSLSSGMLVGTFDFEGRPYSFSLASTPGYFEALTLQDLAGVYTNTLPTIGGGAATTYTIAITADGTVTGSHVNGCIYNGSVSITNTARNMFQLRMQLSNCTIAGIYGPRNGEYTGLGVLLRDVAVWNDPTARKQVFYYSLIGPVWLGTQGAEK